MPYMINGKNGPGGIGSLSSNRPCDCTETESIVTLYLNPVQVSGSDVPVQVPVTKEVCDPTQDSYYEWECDEEWLENIIAQNGGLK